MAILKIRSGGAWVEVPVGVDDHGDLAGLADPDHSSIGDADGDTKIQVEESADEDKIRFDTGGAERVVIDSDEFIKGASASFAITVVIEDPTSTEDFPIHFFHHAATIQEIEAVVVGSSTPSVTIEPSHHTDRNNAGNDVLSAPTAITNTTTGVTLSSFDDATIPIDSFLWLDTTAQSGTVDSLQLTFRGTYDV